MVGRAFLCSGRARQVGVFGRRQERGAAGGFVSAVPGGALWRDPMG